MSSDVRWVCHAECSTSSQACLSKGLTEGFLFLTHQSFLPMQFYIRGRAAPLSLTSSVPAKYRWNPPLVVAFGFLRMLRCQTLLFPTCSAQVSLQSRPRKSETGGGGRGDLIPRQLFTVSECFAQVAKIPHGFISHSKYLQPDFLSSVSLPAMKASSAASFPLLSMKQQVWQLLSSQ